jgi:hypothetical protein
MINRHIGESMAFTGGAEIPPRATIIRYYMPGSTLNSDKAFEIIQETARGTVQTVILSPQTMEAILKWGAGT